jgi:hypothetical protein
MAYIVTLKIRITCSLVDSHQCLGGTCCLHLRIYLGIMMILLYSSLYKKVYKRYICHCYYAIPGYYNNELWSVRSHVV